jgi:hypothetical protein
MCLLQGVIAMSEQFDQFSHSVDVLRNLGAATLSISEEVVFWQLDNAQSFVALGSQQLRVVLSDARAAQESEQWSTTVQARLHSIIKHVRESLLTASNYQIEGLRLLQKQTTEAQNLFPIP